MSHNSSMMGWAAKITGVALAIVSRNDAGISVLQLTGNLALGPGLRTLEARVDRILGDPQCGGIVLNFSGVPLVDSAGVGALVAIHSAAAGKRVPIVLAEVNRRVKEVFALTRVDALFTFADDEKSAVGRLREK